MLILTSLITSWISISGCTSLVCVASGITSSAVGIKVCAITAVIKKYKSIIRKKKKKHDKIMLLAKDKLITVFSLINAHSFLDAPLQ